MLRRIAEDEKPDYFAVVFDAPGKTFRDDWYPQYKAQRPAMPEDLARQIEPLHDLVRAHGWPLLMIEGVEADDVIGTLAVAASAAGIDCVISTGDKDLAQLVRPGVKLVNTMTNETLDEAGVLAKFGVRADQVLDLLALTGDAVDNVPGVPKVGPKTAAKWLAQYGTLDSVIEHAGDVGGVVGDNLRADDRLVAAGQEAPHRQDRLRAAAGTRRSRAAGGGCRAAEGDVRALRIQGSGFATARVAAMRAAMPRGTATPREAIEHRMPMLARADRIARADTRPFDDPAARAAPAAADAPPPVPRHYETVLDEAALLRWLKEIERAELVSFDTETTGLDPMRAKLVGLSFAIEPGVACYVPLAHRYPGVADQLPFAGTLARLAPWFADASRKKVGQNLKYDQHVLANHGLVLRGVAHDTLLQSYVLEAHRPHDMDNLAWRHLNVKTIAYTDVTGKGAKQIEFDQVGIAEATAYSAEDIDIALQLHRNLYPRIAGDPKLERIYATIEMPVREVLYGMERDGVMLDAALLTAQGRELGGKVMALEQQAFQLAGQPFNLASPKQLGEILFDKMKLPTVRKTATGQPSTDEDVLTLLAADYPLPKVLLEHRALSKLKSTYTDKLPQMVNPTPAACIRRSARPRRSPAGSRRWIPICRTFRCARPKAGAYARRSSRHREA